MRKFQVGDRVVALQDVWLSDVKKGHTYTVVAISEKHLGKPSVKVRGDSVFIFEFVFEHEDVFNSPLYQALK